jgi:hypothetical protein
MKNKFLFLGVIAAILGLIWAQFQRSQFRRALDDILYLSNLARDTRRQVAEIEEGAAND